jgi:hypothetical protein
MMFWSSTGRFIVAATLLLGWRCGVRAPHPVVRCRCQMRRRPGPTRNRSRNHVARQPEHMLTDDFGWSTHSIWFQTFRKPTTQLRAYLARPKL